MKPDENKLLSDASAFNKFEGTAASKIYTLSSPFCYGLLDSFPEEYPLNASGIRLGDLFQFVFLSFRITVFKRLRTITKKKNLQI